MLECFDINVIDRVLSLYAEGMPIYDICSFVGLSDKQVTEIIDAISPFLPYAGESYDFDSW